MSGTPSGDWIAIWKSPDAFRTGLALVRAGVNRTQPEKVNVYIRCLVPQGTRVTITSPGMTIHDVVVVEGRETGCTGSIPVEQYRE